MDSSATSRDGGSSIFIRALAGVVVGLVISAVVLMMAGAPPFDAAFAQNPPATAPATAGQAAAPVPPIEGATGTVWELPVNASEHGDAVDFLFWLITAITFVTFVAVEALLVFFAFKYRYDPNRKAIFTHGNHRLEVVWTVTPAVILFALVLANQKVWAKIRYGDLPPNSTQVEVTAQQFRWSFKMLGTAERFNKGADFAPGVLHVPLGKPVAVSLRSKDVLHSFWLPNFRVKLDAVPGMTGRVWFTPIKTGTYEIACAELCGMEHWNMRGLLKVVTPQEYEAWLLEEAKLAPEKPQ